MKHETAASSVTEDEVKAIEKYFGSFADDYHRAFEGTGRNLLHRWINRVFRRKTFTYRTDVVRTFLEEHGVGGKQVVDFGCGSGEVSLLAARLGARVIGLDIVEDMVKIAREAARAEGVSESVEFRVQDIMSTPPPKGDVSLLVGVIEYYSDLAALMNIVCGATGELVIVVDTRGPLWRRTLRRVLAAFKHFPLYYRSPDLVAQCARRAGFTEKHRVAGHSFTAMAFRRSAEPTRAYGH